MSLSSYAPKTHKVEIPGGPTLVLRPLSMDHLGRLIANHYSIATNLFIRLAQAEKDGQFQAAAKKLAEAQSKQGKAVAAADFLKSEGVVGAVLGVLKDAPAAMAECIALSAGEPEAIPQAMSLPVVVQMECLLVVATLTLEAEGGLEKLAGTVMALVKAAG